MTYYIFVEDEKINGCGEAPILNEEAINYEVTEDIYNSFVQTPDKYIYQNGAVIENPDYESIEQQKEISHRIEEIMLELDEIDSKRIRAICEDEIKDAETGETWLEYYNNQVIKLREELDSLEVQL